MVTLEMGGVSCQIFVLSFYSIKLHFRQWDILQLLINAHTEELPYVYAVYIHTLCAFGLKACIHTNHQKQNPNEKKHDISIYSFGKIAKHTLFLDYSL